MRLVESGTKNLSKKSPTCLAGEFAVLDTLNQNGRTYPKDVYESALQEVLPKISSRSLLGECDHPLSYDEVRLSNVSHVITELSIKDTPEGRKVFGEVELLDTPAGKIIQSLCEAGIPIGISSRAVGDSVLQEDGIEVVTNMRLITYDLVADPSFKGAVLDETTKSKLKESLSSIERHVISLNESRAGELSPTRSLLKSIRESLLCDSTERVHIDTSPLEIQALRSIVESKISKIKRLQGIQESLRESVVKQSQSTRRLRKDLQESKTSLKNLRSNMTKLQDRYNELTETTVSLSDYTSLKDENVELRKKLMVESRGMAYSQVCQFLEGATTDREIESRLDKLSERRAPLFERELSESAKSVAEKTKSNPLTGIISRV